MAIDAEKLQLKRDSAVAALELLIQWFNENDGGWSGRFGEVAAAFRNGDDSTGIQLFNAVRGTGPGSISDMPYFGCGKEHPFTIAYGNASTAVANVRLYIDHELERG